METMRTNEETIQTASSGNHETKETINKNKNKNKRETVSSSSVDGETILSHAGEKMVSLVSTRRLIAKGMVSLTILLVVPRAMRKPFSV